MRISLACCLCFGLLSGCPDTKEDPPETDTDSATETDSDTNLDTETDTDSDIETDTDSDIETDSDTDTASDTDTDTDPVVEDVFTWVVVAHYEDIEASASGLPASSSAILPIRGATVEILRASDGLVLDRGHTDEAGQAVFHLPSELEDVWLRARVISEKTVDGVEAYVVDSQEVLYALTSRPLSGPNTVEFTAEIDPSTGRRAAAFNILDQVVRATDFWQTYDASLTFPRVVLFYEVDSSDGTYHTQRDTQYYGRTRQVHLRGELQVDDDGFDDQVILHELGHYLDSSFSSSGSPGGSHNGSAMLDPGLSLGEGLATYLGQSVLDSPIYLDTYGPTNGFDKDIEDPHTGSSSAGTLYGENTVAAVLWDLTDNLSGDEDPFVFSHGQFWLVFSKDIEDGDYKSLHAYLDAFVARGWVSDSELDAVFGSAPVSVPRPPAPPSPPFPPVIITDTTYLTGEVDATQGYDTSRMQLIDAMAWYGLEISERSTVEIGLYIDDSAANDLDLYLYDTEHDTIQSSRGTGPTELVLTTLAPGKYLIAVKAWSGTDSRAGWEMSVAL